MSTTSAQLAADIAQLHTDAALMHAVIHGDSATIVQTEGGAVRSVANAVGLITQFNYRGAWATGTPYAVKDLFISGSTIYLTVVAHTSTTIAADLAAGRIGIYQGSNSDQIAVSDTTLTGFLQGRVNRVVDSQAALRALAKSQHMRATLAGAAAAGDGGRVDVYQDPTDTTSGAYFTGSMSPISGPGLPALGSAPGGALAAATYFVRVTYVTAAGETLPSPESSLAVAANNVLTVGSPVAQAGVTGYNVYVSTATGTETKQNSAPISIGTNWLEPTTGLIAGAALPTVGTAGALLNVSAVTNGTLAQYQQVNAASGVATCYIMGLVSGTGGPGTYTVNVAQTVASTQLTADNGGTYFVAFDGARWKAAFSGNISIRHFGVLPANADNSGPLAALTSWLSTFTNTATVPRVGGPAGVYSFSTSPNWAIQGLVLEAEVGCVFKHTGSGPVFNVDGGSSGGGVFRVRVEGGLRLQGNSNSTYGLYNRAVHHSYFDVSVRDVAVAAVRTEWVVCNEYRIAITPIGDPAFSVTPTNGFVLEKRGAGEMTSACVFHNPIAEGISSGYGINLQNAVMNTFVGGTSESNGGGVFVSNTSILNRFINTDMEFNTSADILCQGQYNEFQNCLSTAMSTFGGISNKIEGGEYNNIVSNGVDNEFIKARYAANGGTFNDTGTGTIKRSIRSLQSGNLDPELVRNPHKLLYIDGPANNNTVFGSADQLVGGGNANDLCFYHFGSGQVQFWIANIKNLSMAGNQIGFYGSSPIGKPTVSGAKGGNAALGSLIAALSNLGLITDSTTA